MSKPKPMPSYWALAEEVTHLHGQLDQLKAENEKLISVLHEVEAEAVDAYLCLQHDCELLVGELDDRFRKYWHEQDQNEKLREQLQDAEHDESMAWDRVRKAERQNAKLHELVGDLREYIAGNADACEFCSQVGTCENHPAPPPCKYELTGRDHAVLDFIADCLSELGVEL